MSVSCRFCFAAGTSPEAPILARVSSARFLTSDKSHAKGRTVLHVEFDVKPASTSSGSSAPAFTYAPGDSIGLFPTNDRQIVAALLKVLALLHFGCVTRFK